MRRHKKEMLKWGMGRNSFLTSFYILRYTDAKMMLIEDYPCGSEKDLLAREGFHIRAAKGLDDAGCIYDYECVNRIIPGRTPRQHASDNRESIVANRKKTGRIGRWECHICGCYTVWPREIHDTETEHTRRAGVREAISGGVWEKLLRQSPPPTDQPYVYLEKLDRSLDCHIYAYGHQKEHDWDAIDAAVIAYNLEEARKAEAFLYRPDWELIPLDATEELTAEEGVELIALTDPIFDAVVSCTDLLSWSDADPAVDADLLSGSDANPAVDADLPGWSDAGNVEMPSLSFYDLPISYMHPFLIDLDEIPPLICDEEASACLLEGHGMLLRSKL
jgi:hypothetical protein